MYPILNVLHLDSASFPDFIFIPSLHSYNLFRFLHARIIVRRTDAAIVSESSRPMELFAEDLLAWEVPAAAATAPEPPTTMAEKVVLRVSFSAAVTRTNWSSIVCRPQLD